jgi:hypothetical protein
LLKRTLPSLPQNRRISLNRPNALRLAGTSNEDEKDEPNQHALDQSSGHTEGDHPPEKNLNNYEGKDIRCQPFQPPSLSALKFEKKALKMKDIFHGRGKTHAD